MPITQVHLENHGTRHRARQPPAGAGTKAITPSENLTGRTGLGVAKGIPVLQFQLEAMYRRALPISRLHQRGQCLCFRLLALQLLPDIAVRKG